MALEKGCWWLYKVQNPEASRSEHDIAKALCLCGWPAAVYQYDGNFRTRIKSKNFLCAHEFFEPYESFRFMFSDKSDNDQIIYRNIASLGASFERDFRRILLADALFMNSDRHMRNFGVIRSSITGERLRMAPNFDNNQAYKSVVGMGYSGAMLADFRTVFGWSEAETADLGRLIAACDHIPYLAECAKVGKEFLDQ